MTPRATSLSVQFDVPVRMRDGVALAADVYAPASNTGPWPVLLMRTPYGKNTYVENAWSGFDPVAVARSGFMVVIQDTRGRFASEGQWAPLSDDALDGFDSVEWAAGLPGSNGRVGMFGGSYSGNTQWQAVVAGAPTLTAIAPLMTWADPLEGLYARGGAAELGLALPWTLMTGLDDVVRRFEGTATLPGRVGAIFDEIDRLSDRGFWLQPSEHAQMLRHHELRELGTLRVANEGARRTEPADVSGWQSHSGVPAFHTGGWFDLFLQGTLDNYRATIERGLEARLVVGPWSHANFGDTVGDVNFGIRASRDSPAVHPVGPWIDAQVTWLRSHLDPTSSTAERADDPPVRIFVMGRNTWRSEEVWPPADTRDVQWFLHADGVFSPDSPASDTAPLSYTYDLSNPVPTVGGNTYMTSDFPAGPLDQHAVETRTDVLSFTSGPLTADIEVTGRIHAYLHATSSAPSVDWVVRLCDVHTDGRSINVCDGIIRTQDASSRGPHVIDLWSTSMAFLKGHQIRVDVANSSFPRWDRTPANPTEGHRAQRAQLFVDADHPSWITLPIRMND